MKILLRPVWLFVAALATCASLRAQAPAFSGVTDQENAYQFPGNIPGHGQYQVTVSNQPTSITATGVPPGVTFQADTTHGAAIFGWEDDLFTGGVFTVTITAGNAAGSASTSFHWTIHPGLSDFIRPDRSSYTTGDTITFTAKFSAPVVVTGTPYVPLWSTKQANYVGGSGTNTLTFQYTVAADDPAGTYTVDQIQLGTGTIATADGVSASDLTAASTIASPTPTFQIAASTTTTTAPVFGSAPDHDTAYHWPANIPGHGEYQVGISNHPTSVTATGVPPGVNFYGSTASGAAVFDWEDDLYTGGRYTVTMTASNAAGTATQSFQWTVHPGVSDFIREDHFSYAPGATITFTVKFSAPVVVTGTPYIPLWGTKRADYASGSGTNTLLFKYTVAADDPAQTYTVDHVELGTATIATSDGVSASDLTAGNTIVGNTPTFQVVAAPPPPPPPPSTKSDQTITFSSPTSALIVGQPIMLGALSSAGLPITYAVVSGDATISGATLTPLSTAPLVVRASSAATDTYNAASVDVNFGAPQKAAQSIAVASSGGDVMADAPVTLSATSSSGLPVTFAVVSGPATVSGDTLTFTGTGPVVVRASQTGNGSFASAGDVNLTYFAHPVPRLVNVSARVHLRGSGDTAIAGFVVTGASPTKILIRAVGPGLAAFGVSDPVSNPRVTLYDGGGKIVAANAGWADDPAIAAADATVGAFALTAGQNDAALVVTLTPGSYTAHLNGSGAGTALLEVYDLGANDAVPTKQLINVSILGHADPGQPLIVGFVVAGDQTKRVLVRAVGPTLGQFGVGDAAADPMLQVYSGSAIVAENDNWATPAPLIPTQSVASAADISAAAAAVGAFPLPAASKDAGVLLTFAPGAYTAVAGGGTSGTVLIEAYEVP